MSESMLLAVAIFVFVTMVIGLGLTMWEFRYGQPRRENAEGRAARGNREPGGTARAAPAEENRATAV